MSDSPFASVTYRYLFVAHIFSLLSSGLIATALALSAYDLLPKFAGLLLAMTLFAKMLVYVVVAPIVGGLVDRLPRRAWLVGVSLARVICLLLLLSVAQTWQLIVVSAIFYAFTAAFTPVYQALLPDVLPEKAYLRALSWARLAQELENFAAPVIAALLLSVWTFKGLFTSAIFLLGASIVALYLSRLPEARTSTRVQGVWHNISFGIKSYLETPRLRGLLALHLLVAFSGSLLIVNTVVVVRTHFQLDDLWVPLATLASGVAAMLAAWSVPGLLRRYSTRQVMLSGGGMAVCALFLGTAIDSYLLLLPIYALVGAALALMTTPSGRLIIDSCQPGDRSAYFSANFSLSHGMWLFGYVSAGVVGAYLPIGYWYILHALVAAVALMLAIRLWPKTESTVLTHTHEAMEHEHLHWHDEHHQHQHEGWEGAEPHRHSHAHAPIRHQHPLIIDEHHRHWPR